MSCCCDAEFLTGPISVSGPTVTRPICRCTVTEVTDGSSAFRPVWSGPVQSVRSGPVWTGPVRPFSVCSQMTQHRNSAVGTSQAYRRRRRRPTKLANLPVRPGPPWVGRRIAGSAETSTEQDCLDCGRIRSRCRAGLQSWQKWLKWPRPNCRSWEVAPSLNPLPNLHRAGLLVRTAPVSFRRRFSLLIYTFFICIHILPIQYIS